MPGSPDPLRPGRPRRARLPRALASGLGFLLALALSGAVSPLRAQAGCRDCHEDDPDPAAFEASVHGGMDCADCHSGAEDFPHPDGVAKVDCATCHDDVVPEFRSSVHGEARTQGAAEAPNCESCHGPVHSIRSAVDPESPVNHRRLAATCGHCHADPNVVAKYGIPVALPMEAYNDSVHARNTANGGGAATCNDCHGSHAIYDAADSRSKVNHLNVATTCGQCHAKIATAFKASVHGKATAHGVRESPTCTDCHGEHRILSPQEKGSPVFASNIPKMTCGRCHADLRLATKYGIEANTVEAYEDSYHGLASRSGSVTVANCSSCHGVHDILPSSDPSSHTNKANLAQTCGQCHPGAGTRYAIGSVHMVGPTQEHAIVSFVRTAYVWLIFATVGGMLLHNLLDLWRKARSPMPPARSTVPDSRLRMSRGFRAAHGLLMSSFAVLVYSGFALKYPESWWAAPLLRWEESFSFRGWLHRGAAMVILFALAFHVIHILRDRKARGCILEMRPRWEDLREFGERMAYYFGRRPEPPPAPWLGYPEKMEYIALMWGMVIMTVTGLMLWLDNWTLRLLPKWASDLATVVHFYEAVLASLAIVVWHFYFVIFDPVVYPMDTAWITGQSAPGRVAERKLHAEPHDVATQSERKAPAAMGREANVVQAVDSPPREAHHQGVRKP